MSVLENYYKHLDKHWKNLFHVYNLISAFCTNDYKVQYVGNRKINKNNILFFSIIEMYPSPSIEAVPVLPSWKVKTNLSPHSILMNKNGQFSKYYQYRVAGEDPPFCFNSLTLCVNNKPSIDFSVPKST